MRKEKENQFFDFFLVSLVEEKKTRVEHVVKKKLILDGSKAKNRGVRIYVTKTRNDVIEEYTRF